MIVSERLFTLTVKVRVMSCLFLSDDKQLTVKVRVISYLFQNDDKQPTKKVRVISCLFLNVTNSRM